MMVTSIVPARGGAEVALGIYKTFLNYRTCMRRAPAKSVRVLFHMSHLKLQFALHTSHCALHTPHFTLHTSHCTLPTPHSSHFTLHTSHFTLHSPHFTLLTSHCFLHTPHFTLHTPNFTLHSSRPTLHTALFTLHTSSHLSFSPYPSSSLLICHLSFHESLPSTTKELACAVRQPGPCVRALCEAVAVLLSQNMTCARPRCNAKSRKDFSPHFTLHSSHPTLHTCTSSQVHVFPYVS